MDDEGVLYSWGYDGDGGLGNDATIANQSSPVLVDLSVLPAGNRIIDIDTGYGFNGSGGCNTYTNNFVLALDDHGNVYSWGYNGQGQLGIGSTTSQPVPVAVTGGALAGKTITKIFAAYRTSFAIDEDGILYAWGANARGQLGDGSTTNRTSPIAVNISMTSGQIVAVGNNGSFNYNSSDGGTAIIDSDGKAYAFGLLSGLPASYTSPSITNCAWTGVRCSFIPIETPFPIENPPFIVDIQKNTGGYGGVGTALGSDGKIYSLWTGERIYYNTPFTITMDPNGSAANCADATVVSDSEITCVTSAHIEGAVDVKIDIGPYHKIFPQAFTYSKLNIDSITPDIGPTAGGTQVEINGQDFTKMESTVETHDFDYTGAVQPFTATEEDDYILEVWGAQGGKSDGRGGYSTGKIHLTVGETVYVYVGESGGTGCLGRATFGGGGSGYGTSGTCSGSGGGASDIRLGIDSLKARVIVAGGGGGMASTTSDGLRSSDGGGQIGLGGSGIIVSGLYSGAGGNQYEGGAGGTYGWDSSTSAADSGITGLFGVGGDTYHNLHTGIAGAGGGGWYGGGSGAARSSTGQGGGGGSGWVYNLTSYNVWTNSANPADVSGWLLGSSDYLTSAQTVAGNLSMPSYQNAGQFMTGNTGNGHARISRYLPNATAIATRKVIMDEGGTAAPCNISFWSDTKIICTTTAHVDGHVDITIGNDVDSAIQWGGYYYHDAVIATSVSPNSGSIDGGTVITITGDNFNELIPPQVILGDGGDAVECVDVEVINSTTITCTTPPHVSGLVSVRVEDGVDNPVIPAIWNNGKTDENGTTADIDSGFFYIPTYISIGNLQNVNLSVIPNTELHIGSHTVNVLTNNSLGYNMSMKVDENDGDLKHVALTGLIPTISVSQLFDQNIEINSWGLTTNIDPSDGAIWSGAPANLETPLTVRSTTTPNETNPGDQTTITYGTKVNAQIKAGIYVTTILYTATVNI
jgi:hypothetical protein